KVSLQNVINVFRVSINPDMYRIASDHFSRLRNNEIGDLVSVIDDESFDWKLIWTISNLKGNNEVCTIRIKIVVEDGTSCGKFVLLDSAATKLLGRTCSDVFLLLEDELEIVFKVQGKRINTRGYCGTFKIINVISDACFFNKLQADQCIKDVSSDSAFSPILEDFSQCGQLRSYDNQVISGVPIQLHSIKEMLADILCAKIYSSASRNNPVEFHSNASIQCSSSSSAPVRQASSISILNWNCW
ncbi:hypothetical protein S83_055653, partial [Arachis hypogaea]